MSKLKKYLKAVEERAAKATTGPWRYNDCYRIIERGDEERIVTCDGGYFTGASKKEDDAEFIAHSRTDIPRLIKIIDKVFYLLTHRDFVIHDSIMEEVETFLPE